MEIRRTHAFRVEVDGGGGARLLSSPAVLIRSVGALPRNGRVHLDTAPATRDDGGRVERGERRQASASDGAVVSNASRATLPGIGAGVACGVNGLFPSIEGRARGGRARGDSRWIDRPGMLRRPTGSASTSLGKTQDTRGGRADD